MPADRHGDERGPRVDRRGLGPATPEVVARPTRRRGRSASPTSTHDWLDDLYVAPAAPGARRRRGAARPGQGAAAPTGSRCGSSPATSRRARSTARHGLIELEHTDGADNEERSPDVRMAWPGERPARVPARPDRRGRRRARGAARPPCGADRRGAGPQGAGRVRDSRPRRRRASAEIVDRMARARPRPRPRPARPDHAHRDRGEPRRLGRRGGSPAVRRRPLPVPATH